MAYRELSRMEIVEVVRRWQAGASQRAIAGATGLARATVKKYLTGAESLGVSATGPPPTEEQVVALVRLGSVISGPRTWAAPGRDALEAHAERMRSWVLDEHLQLTRVQAHDGVRTSYMTLLQFVRRQGWAARQRSTVRVATTQPGEVAEMDFGRLGGWRSPEAACATTRWAPRRACQLASLLRTLPRTAALLEALASKSVLASVAVRTLFDLRTAETGATHSPMHTARVGRRKRHVAALSRTPLPWAIGFPASHVGYSHRAGHRRCRRSQRSRMR